ncbi:MAG: ATP-binding protein [Gammaproteobacteria bacterium]
MPRRRLPDTLFARTAALFLTLVLGFQLLVFSVAGYFVLWPLMTGSANDLAALIELSVRSWDELPASRRPAYLAELARSQQLQVAPATDALAGERSLLPYAQLLERALARRFDAPVSVVRIADGPAVYAVDVPARGARLRVRFSHARIGTNPWFALAASVAGSVLLGLVGALLVARRLTRPLAQFAHASERVGRGEALEPLPETGPAEIARLARNFNRMATQVRELLDNRTTLLAGVSHDLRTPIARLRLALELQREHPDAAGLARMERYLDDMNALVASFLDFARGVADGERAATDVGALLESMAAEARAAGADVVRGDTASCTRMLAPFALRRVLQNLVDNAVRHGGGRVELALDTVDGRAVIEVRDRGPGIPPTARESVFRPFVRLDPSRNASTGGVGLGLAIARQIAQTQGWMLSLHAREGGGTVARVELPAVSLDVVGREATQSP